jgi:hypothetical protein
MVTASEEPTLAPSNGTYNTYYPYITDVPTGMESIHRVLQNTADEDSGFVSESTNELFLFALY